MSEWEKFAARKACDENKDEARRMLDELFARYCTPAKRSGYRREFVWFSQADGGTYGGYELTDVESETKNKFYVYAKDGYGFARRFLLIRKDGRWLVDKQQDMDGGWMRVIKCARRFNSGAFWRLAPQISALKF